MKNRIRILIVILPLAIFSNTARASWGDFDTTFGFLGAAIDGIADHYPRGIAVQPDGKILVTGYYLVSGRKRFFLRRYLSNGSVDTSFGNNGSAVSNALIVINADYSGYRIVVQANGRIAVAGLGNTRPTIWRFLSSGFADTSIGAGGMKTLSAYAANFNPVLATYSNILYAGVVEDGSTSTVILKFNSSGSQDTSFGNSGEAQTDANGAFSMDVDPTSGNILVSGRRRSDPNDYGVERFLTTGVLDPTFTHWGAAYGGWVGSNPSSFVRLANGEFVLNERSYNVAVGGATLWASIVRLSSSGSFISRSLYEPSEFVYGAPAGSCPDVIAQQQNGKVVLKGANSDELFRFSTDFSTVHTMSCSSYSSMSSPTPAVLQSDDKMIAAGIYNGAIVIVRTLP